MTDTIPECFQKVKQLYSRTDTPAHIKILADAILHLAMQGRSQRDNNRSAFEQIKELDRRQENDAH